MKWKDIPNYPKYEVSDSGVVRLKQCKTILRQHSTYNRKVVHLRNEFGAKKHRVHRLVALAFIGECPKGMECCHNDGDCTNNHVSNLRYATHSENELDKRLHGTDINGERHHAAKLNIKQVLEIKSKLDSGKYRVTEICRQYNVSDALIYLIKKNKVWKHELAKLGAIRVVDNERGA